MKDWSNITANERNLIQTQEDSDAFTRAIAMGKGYQWLQAKAAIANGGGEGIPKWILALGVIAVALFLLRKR